MTVEDFGGLRDRFVGEVGGGREKFDSEDEREEKKQEDSGNSYREP